MPGIPGLLDEAFSDCEQHHIRPYRESQETAWARTIGLNRGFAPWNPSPVKLHCQVNISTRHLLTMHAVSLSENVSQAVRVKIKLEHNQ